LLFDKAATRLSIRLLDGTRVVRKFATTTSMQDLYAFVECYDLVGAATTVNPTRPVGYSPKYGLRLVSPMPRNLFDPEAGGMAGERIGRSGNLIVESILDDEDNDAE
jgi:FAS-associated factor 2